VRELVKQSVRNRYMMGAKILQLNREAVWYGVQTGEGLKEESACVTEGSRSFKESLPGPSQIPNIFRWGTHCTGLLGGVPGPNHMPFVFVRLRVAPLTL